MSSTLESSTSPSDIRRSNEKKESPPAFLDLADSAARLGANMPDISARVELKRMEHERQRVLQRKMFDDQMRALEHQQEQELLKIPLDGNSSTSMSHLAVSAPTTPPRVNAHLNGELSPGALLVDANMLSHAVGKVNYQKSVSYASSTNLSPDVSVVPIDTSDSRTFGRTPVAKSMPASRRTSASSHDEELASQIQGLSVNEKFSIPHSATATTHAILRHGNDVFRDFRENGLPDGGVNAGLMLDEQLDQEMHDAMRSFPNQENERYVSVKISSSYPRKLSVSSAALDLAPLSQTPPRGSFISRASVLESREQPSEWPQFTSTTRLAEPFPSRIDQRTVIPPQLSLSSTVTDLPGGPTNTLVGSVSASGTPHIQQNIPSLSRRSSPLGMTIQSGRPDFSSLTKTPTTPLASEPQSQRLAQHGVNHITEVALNKVDLGASLSRVSPSQNENLGYTALHGMDNLLQQKYDVESIYGLNNGVLDDEDYGGYRYDSSEHMDGNASVVGGSPALYQSNGTRYGLGTGVRLNSVENKMNGLHGPKHKRGDGVDRDFNRFAGTRLEDLQGDIANLCKDQHGCRYLQKKLEEGVPEHRDMIFRETFGHFADLMTDPFGNYLCQKLLEFSTDDQRNVICESVAQDLVNISLNMHGTRAVQKMIDFLSTQRQTDVGCNVQIHSIIVALSLHVVVLIKDLNGNHVIQKCLNKLAPDDNQFIYNAVAANCVEVATHRHGCCVLQRCIDHASESQRVQLVNEITYNALTLVQDPYGNYVVQYILDLNENRFSDGVIRQFTGNICALSVQKFSSNVIEKCIRVAENGTRKLIVEELLNRTRLEKLLRDAFGNYCVQTALDYADPIQRNLLVEGIRPILPLIRNTPYGKRIQSKLQREQLDASGQFIYQNQQANAAAPVQGNAQGNHGALAYGHGQSQVHQHGNNQGHAHNHGQIRQIHQQNAYQHTPHHQTSRHTGQLAGGYNNQNGLYNQGRNGTVAHGQHNTGHVHGQQNSHNVSQLHSIDSYVMQRDTSHSGTPNGFNNVNIYSNSVPGVHSYGTPMALNGNLSAPYHRPSFGYGV